MTRDLDLLPERGPDNLRRLGAAMSELGAHLRVEGLTVEESRALPVQLQDDGIFRTSELTNWVTDAGDVDVMLSMPDRDGVRHPYEHYVGRAVDGTAAGAPVRLAHLADVIGSKEHAAREKDLVALPALRLLLARSELDELG